ncbi:unnamed protein product [Lathyrus oleraceus]
MHKIFPDESKIILAYLNSGRKSSCFGLVSPLLVMRIMLVHMNCNLFHDAHKGPKSCLISLFDLNAVVQSK